MPSRTIGNPQIITEKILVGGDDEIPQGSQCLVINKSIREYDQITYEQWADFWNGDLTTIKDDIETSITGSKVIFLEVKWSKEEFIYQIPQEPPSYENPLNPDDYTITAVKIYDFTVQAIVENVQQAGLTGLEIAAIILASAVLAVIIGFIALGSWITFEVLSSIPDFTKPIIGIPLIIVFFGMVFILALTISGGRISKKKGGYEIGQA